MRKLALIILIFLSAATSLRAGTVTVGPSDCSAATINAAISASTTHDGDTVLLTCTGSVNWTATVNIPSSKGLSLMVQNGTNGTWNGGRTARTGANFPLTISVPSGGTAIIATIATGNSVVRISGFKFQNSGTADPFLEFTGCGNGPSNLGAFRLDNNYFDTISGVENVVVWAGKSGCTGQLWGLADNNTFHNVYRGSDTAYGPYNFQVWNYWHPTGSNQCWGCNGWTDNDFAYGSEHQVFIEDNLFEQTASAPAHMRHYISAELGGRYVSRYNTFVNNYPDNNADLHDAHGLCLVSSNGAGARGGEIYSNLISGTGYNRATVLRGGSWLIYNNVFATGGGTSNPPAWLEEYRAETPSSCETSNALAIEPQWPVPANADWNPNATWQPYVTGGTGYQLPEQIFYTFAWNNKNQNDTLLNMAVDPDYPNVANYIQNNRDYCCDNQTSQPTAVGPHSFTYTPYLYPNPLQSQSSPLAPDPPTGLAAIVK